MKRIAIGIAVIIVSEAGMLLKLEPFWSWHTPIAWTGYVVLVDGLVYRRRGHSWLSNSLPEFAFLAAVSFPLWLVFEFYDLFIRNWHYVNLPQSAFWRDVGYVWAFATIWPAIFETADLVASIGAGRTGGSVRAADAAGFARFDEPAVSVSTANRASAGFIEARGAAVPLSRWGSVSVVLGAAMLVWPLVFPSRYLAAPVWLGFSFLLDPLNARAGGPSLTGDYRRCRLTVPGRGLAHLVQCSGRAVNLMLAGLVCGFVWEFWNYWARTKWIYTVPILPNVKLFEMPVAGYLGFPAFALECFTMYVAVRLLVTRRPGRPIAL
jgi:hypothetical protein